MATRPRKPKKPASRAAARPGKESLAALSALMKFRLVINSTKHHFNWVEKQCGISGAQLWALWEIQRAPGLRVSALAKAMAMHQTTVSNLIDKLSRAKLVERKRSPSDQRVVALNLTTAGGRMVARAPRPARGMLAEALHHMTEPEIALLDALLRSLLDYMKPIERQAMKKPLSDMLT